MITITLLNILYTHKKELLIMTNKFAIIGCGGRGFRHLLGYMEYLNYDQDLELVAVVDPNKESSKYLSDHFLNNTGKKINSFNTLDELNQSNLSLDSVDITSTNDEGIVTLRRLWIEFLTSTSELAGLRPFEMKNEMIIMITI